MTFFDKTSGFEFQFYLI